MTAPLAPAARAGRRTQRTTTPGRAAPDDDRPRSSADYVSFEMAGQMYALEMERVQEIIRLPSLVQVPLGPRALGGLANLRGRVLPVVSLRSCCGLPAVAHAEATRVVVVEVHGTAVGLVVDRVAAVVAVEQDRVESAEGVQSAVRAEVLAAVLRDDDGGLTSVLDVERVVVAQFSLLAGDGRAHVDRPGAPGSATADEEALVDTLELVSFAVDGQEYALPIDRVQEIVQVPERVTSVPNAADRVLGVMDLRGGLLAVLSLRRVFGLEVPQLQAHNRIVVVTSGPGGGDRVGIAMDTVREVLRVPRALVDGLPPVVSGGSGRGEVEAVCRLDGGERLVSVLSVEALVPDGERLLPQEMTEVPLPRAEDQLVEEQVDERVDEQAASRGDDELFVVFRVGEEQYCVDVDAVQEIIRVPDGLVRVPLASALVEGLVNLRGAVLPVVDLRTRLGLARHARDERQRIVVLLLHGLRTGFVVDAVAEVARVASTDLGPAPALSAEQAAVVTRVAHVPVQGRMMLVLEPEHLLGADQRAQLEDAVAGGQPAEAVT